MRRKDRLFKSSTGVFLVILVLLLFGMVLSIEANRIINRFQNEIDTDIAVCSGRSWQNCYVPHISSYSSMFNIPLARLALIFYIWFAYCIGLKIFSKNKEISPFLVGVSFISVCISLYQAYVLYIKLDLFCYRCSLMYLINLSLFGLTILSKRSGKKGLRSRVAFNSNLKLIIEEAHQPVALVLLFILGVFVSFRSESNKLNISIDNEIQEYFSEPIYYVKTNSFAPSWGEEPNISVVIVSDFECAFCRIAAFRLRAILWEYRKKIKLYFINYPLDKSINRYVLDGDHSLAGLCSLAATAAEYRGDFWGYHDDLFRNQKKLSMELLINLAGKRGWDKGEFLELLHSKKVYERVQAQIEIGHQLDIEGTPGVYINGRKLSKWYKKELVTHIISTALKANRPFKDKGQDLKPTK